jgi:hypothetical protein
MDVKRILSRETVSGHRQIEPGGHLAWDEDIMRN